MILGWCVSCILEIVGTFVWREGWEQLADGRANGFNGACGGLAQQVLELGEDLLDRVEVGRVFRQEDQFGTHRADQPAHGLAFVAAKIVPDEDCSAPQGGEENSLTVSLEALC